MSVKSVSFPTPGTRDGGVPSWVTPAALTLLLLAAELHSHLLFHTLAELFAASVALLAAVVGWQAYPLSRNNYLMYLACGYFWIGGLDLIHLLTYPGHGLFTPDGGARSIQFWVGTRYLEALVLLTAPFALGLVLDRQVIFRAFGLLAALLSAAIVAESFPQAYVPGVGLTPFKIVSEYIIIALLVGALLHLHWRRQGLDPELVRWMNLSIVLTVVAEFAFTRYTAVGEDATVVGHVLRLWSYWFIYVAVIGLTLREPFRTLARDANTFDAVPDPTVVVDERGVIRQANKAARRYLGLEQGDIIGRDCHELLHPQGMQRSDCPVCRHMIALGSLEGLELEYPERDMWQLISIAPFSAIKGPAGMVHVSRDITQHKRAEAALKRSEENYRTLFEGSSDALFVHPVPTAVPERFLNVNAVACERLGYSREELLSLTAADISEGALETFERVMTEFSAQGHALFEAVHVTKEGVRIPVEVSARRIVYNGRDAILSIARDISGRKQRERALRDSEKQYRTLVDNLPHHCVFLKDTHSRYVSCNRTYAELLGVEPGEVAGRGAEEFHPQHLADKYRSDDLRIMASGQTETFEETHWHEGREVFIQMVKTPVRDAEGNVTGVLGIFWDVTEQKRAAHELLESQLQLAEGERLARLGSWRWEAASGRLRWSDGMYRIFGVEKGRFEPTYETVLAAVPEPDCTALRQAVTDLTQRAEPVHLEHAIIRGDGERRIVHVQMKPVKGEDGGLVGLVGTDLDITERRKIEDALQSAHDQLEGIFSNIHVQIACLDVQFNYLRVNPSYAACYGRPPEFFTGLNLLDLVDGQKATLLREAVRRGQMVSAHADPFPHPCCCGSEGGCYLDWTLYPIKDDGGELSGFLFTAIDVTPRKVAQDALVESERKYRALMENASDAILVSDAGGRFVDANRRAEALLGYPKEELLELGPEAIHPAERREVVRAVFRELDEKGATLHEHVVVRKDGQLVPVEVAGTRIRCGEGDLYLGNFRDISERKRIERELQQHREHLELLVEQRTRELRAMNKELESFSYSVSHDLRAPLRAINGFSMALVEDCYDHLDDQGRDYIQRIRGATNRMSELIDGLLNLSQVIRRDLNWTEVDLSNVAVEMARMLHGSDPRRDVEWRIDPTITVQGDLTLLRLLLQNLLGNAWKFTAGRSHAVVEFGRETLEGRDVYYVRDNGVGFEMQYAHKLFQPFQRLHGQEEYEGTGIGLATVRRIVQRHGGRVWAEGEPGKGATVYFSLRAKAKGQEHSGVNNEEECNSVG